MTDLVLSPDRLLPADPATRSVARRLYQSVAGTAIYSPHSHVDPSMLVDDEPFSDPAALFITPDHYVTRLLHAHGVSLRDLGCEEEGRPGETSARAIWRLLCTHWPVFAGTPVRWWLETELSELFGVRETPSAATADRIYDHLCQMLSSDAFRPRALFARFGLKLLATTDDPADDLSAHRALRADPSFSGHVVPTFRPDRYFDPTAVGWTAALADLAASSDTSCETYSGLLEALRKRRAVFAAHGATASDMGVPDAGSTPLTAAEAERIHRSALTGQVSVADATAYRHNMLFRMAEMSCEDGLVMQLHPGVIRNHHLPTLRAHGPNTGHDLPDATSFTRPLAPLLNAFGTHPQLRLILFTVDETTFSRDIAPLAGFYPTVYAGAPWWFLDSPAAIARFRAAVTDSASFTKTSGFIDDTRAFCSIPARHDMSRRADAAHLAHLVVTHQLPEDEAIDIARRLVSEIPVHAFKLEAYTL
ncbi:glucuronate isomerase [Kineococcus gypseus]|uniref:glucuronate isomerase n=1 Tax=Kineococcus gypseus TaxID=1637102 RepID=UPI003D7E57C5